ncbi:MAG: EAL domain-containing protein [Neomegalonema sp.]|nr:EAL domain-containing protein [Neomegalonema sp.]
MAIVDDKPRSATVIASTDCQLLVLPRDQLQHRMRVLDPVLRMVLSVILDRFRDSVRHIGGEAPAPAQPAAKQPDLSDYLSAIEVITLEQSLKQALERDELVPFYQPIMDTKSGTIAGFELLARWNHPERGILPPGVFITVAEQSGLVREISLWALRRACVDMEIFNRARQDLGAPGCFIAVNVTGDDICAEGFAQTVATILQETGADPRWLELEITESTLIDHASDVIDKLQKLRALGLSISIDDFGTGYSNLRYLAQYPVQKLKIDKGFIDPIAQAGRGREIVRAMIELGHILGLRLVAEGIEDCEQVAILRELGCDYLQGYHFSRPLSYADSQALLCQKVAGE